MASLVITRELDAPAPRVWAALTDIALLKQWSPFFSEFKPEVGFETHFVLGPDGGRQYEHICRVTEVTPEQKLTYSWHYTEVPGMSYVTFELTPHGDKTTLTLTHNVTESFPTDNPDFTPESFEGGWNSVVDALRDFATPKQ